MLRFLIGFGVFAGFLAATTAPSDYVQTIQAWQQHRLDGLRKPDSWLTLVGLYRLKPGNNSIGSAEGNDLVLPNHGVPAHWGTAVLSGETVTFTSAGQPQRTLAYEGEHPDEVKSGSVSFFVIKRGDQFLLRAKDSESPVLKNFKGTEFFPINPSFHFQAKLLPDAKKIPILNVLGQTEQQESPGVVEFSYQGHTYHVRPIFEGEGAKKTLFFLFKDPTNKVNTYQAGRMLNTPLPVDGKVDLDFNRSYNPPCTFTAYATCPLPPKENQLAFAVQAGEKRYGSGHAEYTAR